MNLSRAFEICTKADWVTRHNREVREVCDSHHADKPIRVPVQFTGARVSYFERNGVDWRRFYEDPDEMIRLQLEAAKHYRELPLGDHVLGEAPEHWDVSVDFHPVGSAACFGCPLLFRPDAVPASESLHLSLDQCRELPLPDLRTSGLLPRYAAFVEHFDRRCSDGLRFLGRGVRRVKPTLPSPGGGTFSLALDLRGSEIMSDMYEDPDFVHAFLLRLAEWRIDLRRTWTRRDGMEFLLDQPGKDSIEITDHGIDMLSVQTYETFLGSLVEQLCRKYSQSPNRLLHHCGRGTHLFSAMRRRYGFTTIHGLTWPVNDVAKVRRELGYDVWIEAVVADSILCQGPDATRHAVREFLTPEVKGSGRLQIWVPGEVQGIPRASYEALYQAVKDFGRYQ